MYLHKNMSNRLVWTATLLALALISAGCSSSAGQQAGPAAVPEVATITIQPQRVELTTELPGRTSPYLVAEIRPQVNGIIKKREFREGSDVKAGQLLYQIDPAPFQVALDSARASFGKAEANLPSSEVEDGALPGTGKRESRQPAGLRRRGRGNGTGPVRDRILEDRG